MISSVVKIFPVGISAGVVEAYPPDIYSSKLSFLSSNSAESTVPVIARRITLPPEAIYSPNCSAVKGTFSLFNAV